jgi:hypothetical protein
MSDQTFRVVDTKEPISVQFALRTAIFKFGIISYRVRTTKITREIQARLSYYLSSRPNAGTVRLEDILPVLIIETGSATGVSPSGTASSTLTSHK